MRCHSHCLLSPSSFTSQALFSANLLIGNLNKNNIYSPIILFLHPYQHFPIVICHDFWFRSVIVCVSNALEISNVSWLGNQKLLTWWQWFPFFLNQSVANNLVVKVDLPELLHHPLLPIAGYSSANSVQVSANFKQHEYTMVIKWTDLIVLNISLCSICSEISVP